MAKYYWFPSRAVPLNYAKDSLSAAGGTRISYVRPTGGWMNTGRAPEVRDQMKLILS
jgi:hypothetical protein